MLAEPLGQWRPKKEPRGTPTSPPSLCVFSSRATSRGTLGIFRVFLGQEETWATILECSSQGDLLNPCWSAARPGTEQRRMAPHGGCRLAGIHRAGHEMLTRSWPRALAASFSCWSSRVSSNYGFPNFRALILLWLFFFFSFMSMLF